MNETSNPATLESNPLATNGTDVHEGICPTCGQAPVNKKIEQFLALVGIDDKMIGNLKSQVQNVDLDEYLETARAYLKDSGAKAGNYAKENPGKVAAGVAAVALGAGLIYAAKNK